MNKKVLLTLSCALLLSGCNNVKNDEYKDTMSYETRQVKLYRNKEIEDKQLSLRFYESTPSIPYISVKEYYKEFFKADLSLKKIGTTYKYVKGEKGYLAFDVANDVLTSNNIDAFSDHPDLAENNKSYFLKKDQTRKTTPKEISVSLRRSICNIITLFMYW